MGMIHDILKSAVSMIGGIACCVGLACVVVMMIVSTYVLCTWLLTL